MASMRFNPPPGWPPVPPGWAPPPGWQPDPSWPDPPPGWNLWIEDTAVTRIAATDAQTSAAKWIIAGGGAAFLGSLLPFLSSPDPYLYTVNPAPKDSAAFFGVMLAVLGILVLAGSHRARLISGIAAFVVAGLGVLTLGGCILAGIAGADETDSLMGTVQVNFSPQIGIFISILGCAAAGIGAMRSFAHPVSRVPG
jgi:hypothetical protein